MLVLVTSTWFVLFVKAVVSLQAKAVTKSLAKRESALEIEAQTRMGDTKRCPLFFVSSASISGYKGGCHLLLPPPKQPKVDIGKVDIGIIHFEMFKKPDVST